LCESESESMRASDRDRNAVTAALRVHCLEGRITFEELERRVERARIIVPARMRRTRAVALDAIAPALNRLNINYELKRQSAMGLEFERTPHERVVISFEEHGSSETTMIVYGRAPRAVRKTFAKLDFS
jgi:Domain of unknown function (DUF1707)